MKAINKIGAIFSTMLLLVAATGCEATYNEPAYTEPVVMEATHTIAELKAMFTTTPSTITEDMVIKAQVISTDKYGNFYRDLYVQDSTAGLKISVGLADMYNEYPVGTEVYIKPQGLTYGEYRGIFGIGAASSDSFYEFGFIFSRTWVEEVLFCGEKSLPLDTLAITSDSDISDENLLKLVRLENVTFSKGDNYDTWAASEDKENTGYVTHYVNIGSKQISVRTSSYSSFATDSIPATGSTIDITGVLTKYGTTWQFSLNNAATDVVVK